MSQTSPFGMWCNAVTIPVAPACLISSSETGSLGPYQRHVFSNTISSVLIFIFLNATKGTKSAVNWNNNSCNKTSLVANQPIHHALKFLRFPKSLHRGLIHYGSSSLG